MIKKPFLKYFQKEIHLSTIDIWDAHFNTKQIKENITYNKILINIMHEYSL